MRTGLIFTPISTHLKVDETAYILENCGAKLFVASAALDAVATQLRGKVAGIERFYMVRGISDGFESWEEAVDVMPNLPVDDQFMGSPMLYSSGTTGKPKGIFIPPATEIFDAPWHTHWFLSASVWLRP